MTKFCGKCGAPIDENKKFCPKCGAKLKPVGISSQANSPGDEDLPEDPDKSNNNFIKILLIICCILLLGGGGFYFWSKDKPANTAADNTTAAETKTPEEEKPEKFPMFGITTDVIRVQTTPTIMGQWTGRLDDEEEVKIFSKYVCNEKNAAVFDKAIYLNVYDLDNKNKQILLQNGGKSKILIMKGHAAEILDEGPNSYRCRFTHGKADITYDFPKSDIRKIYGDAWYEIESQSDGTKGYVYSGYVKLK